MAFRNPVRSLDASAITGQIGAGQIADGAVIVGKLGPSAVALANIADLAVNAQKIADNAVNKAKIATNAVGDVELIAGSVIAGKIAAGGVVAGNIAANAVTAGTIAASAVTAGTIAADAVTAASIAADAIDGKTITGSTVQSSNDGRRIVLAPDGNLYFFTGASGEAGPAFVRLNAQSMLVCGPQFKGVEYGLTLRDSFGRTSATIDTEQTTIVGDASVGGVFSASNMAFGSASITPAANTDTNVTVTGVGLLPGLGTYRVWLLANTGSPGQINGISATGATADGFTLLLNRSTTTVTNVWWLMLGK